MTSCRGCKSARLYLFLPLGPHPLANGFLRKEQLNGAEQTFPLDAFVCLDCGLIQVRDSVPPGFFRNYVYIPSASESMRKHFAGFADQVAQRFLSSENALTVDIGCNDGLFLKRLKSEGKRTLGVDPATNIIEMARREGLEIINEYFSPEIAGAIRQQHGPAAVIVTTNTYHHIGDLDSFTNGVRLLLDENGVFVIEVPHAEELIAQGEFDGIYHEHVSQFTVKSLVDHLRRFGLEVIDIEKLSVHGGSIRVFAAREGKRNTASPVVQSCLAKEARSQLFTAATYDKFRERVEKNKTTLLNLLSGPKREGKKLAGYGASARGNTLLNYYGIGTNLLDYIVDRNALKHGLYTPGMQIPVYPVEKVLEDRPDYLLLVAWNFADEIVGQLGEYRRKGGKFILPIPEPRVLGDSHV